MDAFRCNDDQINRAIEEMRTHGMAALGIIDSLMEQYPSDPRLCFLRGSLLASNERYADAVREFEEALEIDPVFDVARFQLGLLHATQKRSADAMTVWLPLQERARDDGLAMFAFGLAHLLRGDLASSRRCLRAGIALNTTSQALSIDMERVVERIEARPVFPAGLEHPSERSEHLLISEYLLGRYSTH